MFRLSQIARLIKGLFGKRKSSGPPAQPPTRGDELRAAFAERRSPAFVRTELDAWGRAINRLCTIGELDAAEHATRHLLAAFPQLPFARRLCEVFDRMPPVDSAQMPFKDDEGKDVQVVHRRGTDLVILLFCGGADKFGLPLPMIHRWLGRLPASLVYLRDFQRARYLQGVQSLGPDFATTCAELRRTIASLGGRRLACAGTSGGVFPALYYGHALGAEAILCVAGKTNVSAEFNTFTPRKEDKLDVARRYAHLELDARRLYEALPRPPRISVIYGQEHWNDRRQAEHLGVLDCVTLWPVENYSGHDVTLELIRRDQYERALQWLVAPPPERVSTPAQPRAIIDA
jgi:hypothetical protein